MVVNIVISGEIQCEDFAEVCLIADYLCQNLPNFSYKRIAKSVLEWPQWLCKLNLANNWHHVKSPIIWKEILYKGGKRYYIGGASQFLEYIHSYYNFDVYMCCEKYQGLIRNFGQFNKKLRKEEAEDSQLISESEPKAKTEFVVCISGAASSLASGMVSRLLDLAQNSEKTISKVFLYDEDCSEESLLKIETQCSFIGTKYPAKVVKYADKIGTALTISDLLIVLDHVPFDPEKSIGEWLHANRKLMQGLAIMINASASRAMNIVFANVGPACFNATVLMHSVTINPKNIVVATSDKGLQIVDTVTEVCDVPTRMIYCPPVWGFVGINHLVDLKNTVHHYNSFEPYTRFTKIKNSTLNIGVVTPEVRTLEYLTYFDDTIWVKYAEKTKILPQSKLTTNKVVSMIMLIRRWMIEPAAEDTIVCLGLLCDGSFGLTFDGAFSQPARLIGKEWRPATEFFMPKDNFVKLSYLQYMAEMVMKLDRTALPPINQYFPCKCKKVYEKKKNVW